MIERQQEDLHRAEVLCPSSRLGSLVLGTGFCAAPIGSFLIMNRVTRGVTRVLESANRIAAGEMKNPVKIAGNNELAQILDALRRIEQRVGHGMAKVQQRCASPSKLSTYLLVTAQPLPDVTSEQAASVGKTSAAIEQMSASIAQTSEKAKEIQPIALWVSQETRNGGRAERDRGCHARDRASIRIVDDIAYQTRLFGSQCGYRSGARRCARRRFLCGRTPRRATHRRKRMPSMKRLRHLPQRRRGQ